MIYSLLIALVVTCVLAGYLFFSLESRVRALEKNFKKDGRGSPMLEGELLQELSGKKAFTKVKLFIKGR